MGSFQLGSTVIVLFAKDQVKWLPGLKSKDMIQMGQMMGQCKGQETSSKKQGTEFIGAGD